MHKKRAKDGLVCISVSVDPPKNKDAALRFLQQKQATFPNYWLNEEGEAWQDYFDLATGPPLQLVYGRDGKLARRVQAGTVTHQELDAYVEKLLRETK